MLTDLPGIVYRSLLVISKRFLPRRLIDLYRRLRFNRAILRALNRPLHEYKYSIFSQNGEDGVVEELLHRLQISEGWVVEFGAWDGTHLSNTFRLISDYSDFRAVYIEGDKQKYQELVATANKYAGRIIPVNTYVQPKGGHSLDAVLKKTPIPPDFDLLSIDIDGPDFHIWDRLSDYYPKIVIIEINSSIPPDTEQVHGIKAQGTSFKSMVKLGERKGYKCVCHIGNVFFVRNNLIGKLRLSRKSLRQAERLFLNSYLAKSC